MSQMFVVQIFQQLSALVYINMSLSSWSQKSIKQQKILCIDKQATMACWALHSKNTIIAQHFAAEHETILHGKRQQSAPSTTSEQRVQLLVDIQQQMLKGGDKMRQHHVADAERRRRRRISFATPHRTAKISERRQVERASKAAPGEF